MISLEFWRFEYMSPRSAAFHCGLLLGKFHWHYLRAWILFDQGDRREAIDTSNRLVTVARNTVLEASAKEQMQVRIRYELDGAFGEYGLGGPDHADARIEEDERIFAALRANAFDLNERLHDWRCDATTVPAAVMMSTREAIERNLPNELVLLLRLGQTVQSGVLNPSGKTIDISLEPATLEPISNETSAGKPKDSQNPGSSSRGAIKRGKGINDSWGSNQYPKSNVRLAVNIESSALAPASIEWIQHVGSLLSEAGIPTEGLDSRLHLADVEHKQLNCATVAEIVKDIVEAESSRPQTGQVQLVTLLQASALCQRSKRTLERYSRKGQLPRPSVVGTDGRAHEWNWNELRPVLEGLTGRQLPTAFPGIEPIR